MNSFNHYAFGAIGEWMYQNILGIQLDTEYPGFSHFILKPLPGGTLTWAKGSYHSISGKIDAKWKKEGDQFEYEFTVPANTTATVCIPGKSIETVSIDGEKLTDRLESSEIDYKNNYIVFEAQAGTYSVTSEM